MTHLAIFKNWSQQQYAPFPPLRGPVFSRSSIKSSSLVDLKKKVSNHKVAVQTHDSNKLFQNHSGLKYELFACQLYAMFFTGCQIQANQWLKIKKDCLFHVVLKMHNLFCFAPLWFLMYTKRIFQ